MWLTVTQWRAHVSGTAHCAPPRADDHPGVSARAQMSSLLKTLRIHMERDPIVLFSCVIGTFGMHPLHLCSPVPHHLPRSPDGRVR